MSTAQAAGGVDLNRLWRAPSRDLEPSLFYSLKTMMEIDADESFSLDTFIDIHSHSNSRAGFLYMNPLPASHSGCAPLAELLYRLPKVMASQVPGFHFNKCCSSTEASKASCGRRVAGMHLPNTLCYTFEISFFNAAEESASVTQKYGKAVGQSGTGVCTSSHLHQSCGLPTQCLVVVMQSSATMDHTNSVNGYHDMGKGLACSFLTFYNKPTSSGKLSGSTHELDQW